MLSPLVSPTLTCIIPAARDAKSLACLSNRISAARPSATATASTENHTNAQPKSFNSGEPGFGAWKPVEKDSDTEVPPRVTVEVIKVPVQSILPVGYFTLNSESSRRTVGEKWSVPEPTYTRASARLQGFSRAEVRGCELSFCCGCGYL